MENYRQVSYAYGRPDFDFNHGASFQLLPGGLPETLTMVVCSGVRPNRLS
jgi:hypothetical protein